MISVNVVTPPPFEPLTLAEVYRSLRLDTEGSPETHPDDTMLAAHIIAARQDIETRAHRSFVQQTLRASFKNFPLSESVYELLSPSSRRSVLCAIRLPRPPVVRVESVQYYNSENVLATVDAADYYLTDEEPPELRFASTFVTPTVYNRPDAVRVTYVAGYAPDGSPATTQEEYAANVPQRLKQAMLLSVQCLYDDLQPADYTRIQTAIEALVQQERIQVVP